MNHRLSLALKALWALPCSAIGACAGLGVVALGGSARRVEHTFEVALSGDQDSVPGWAKRCDILAITLGHVIVGQSHQVLATLRAHERAHVRQYEMLGPLFFPAYAAASVVAWLRGQCPYRGNHFEMQAFSEGSRNAARSRHGVRGGVPDDRATRSTQCPPDRGIEGLSEG